MYFVINESSLLCNTVSPYALDNFKGLTNKETTNIVISLSEEDKRMLKAMSPLLLVWPSVTIFNECYVKTTRIVHKSMLKM